MAIVVLFSTMSFTVDMHYCGDTLMDSSIFKKAEACAMQMSKTPLKECVVDMGNCCTDKQITLTGQDDLQQIAAKTSLNQQIFITSFVVAYLNLFQDVNKENTSHKKYFPPLVSKQIYKLDETYLI